MTYRASATQTAQSEIGQMRMTMEETVPSGWLKCEGETISDTGDGGTYAGSQYEALFGILKDVSPNAGTEVWGTDTVTLPDMRRTAPQGKGGTGSGEIGNGIGASGGDETVALSEAEMPAHTHTYDRYGSAGVSTYLPTTSNGTAASNTTDSTGSGSAHNNLGPRRNVLFIIRYQ